MQSKLTKYLCINSTGKFLILAFFGLLLMTTAISNTFAQQPGDVDLSFTGGVMKGQNIGSNDEKVQGIVIQPDGKHIVVGYFRTVNGTGRNYIARINADGSLDTTFDTGVGLNNYILSAAIQPDGKIVVGGWFDSFTNNSGTITKRRIARLNTDGTLDTSFAIGSGANANVRTVVLQPDGKILIGGDFATFDGVPRFGIARLNIDGSLDTSFNPNSGINSGGNVQAVALQPDGKVLIGGDFTTFNGIARNDIVRINSDGSLDATFNIGTGSNSAVQAIALQSDGKIVIGGSFNQFNNVTAEFIARLNSDGSRDAFIEGSTCTLTPCPNRNLRTRTTQITVAGNGQIYVSTGSASSTTQPTVWNTGLMRFNTDGSFDTSFITPVYTYNPATTLNRHAVQADGSIVTNNIRSVSGSTPIFSPVIRFNSNGSQDANYNPLFGYVQNAGSASSSITDIMLQPDGKVVVSGNFNIANTTARTFLARFNRDGTLDNNFTAQTDGVNAPYKLLQQPDGKIILAGSFSQVNGTNRLGIARINADGTLDNTFNVGLGAQTGYVFTAALQTDGKIIIGGSFESYNGVARKGIARLNADGSLDTSFNPGSGVVFGTARDGVHAIGLQSDGKIVIGGTFNSYNGTARLGLARLNSDGSLDTTFNSSSNQTNLYALNILPGGKILIGGQFSSYSNVSRNNIARINADGSLDTTFGTTAQTNGAVSEMYVQANGKIIIGGTFNIAVGQIRRGVARFNADGTIDNSFGNNSFGADPVGGENFIGQVVGMAVDESSGKMYFGASFSTFNNIGRGSLVRLFLGANRTVRAPFDFDGDGKTDIGIFRPSTGAWWINASSSNVTVANQFGSSSDKLVPGDFTGDGKADVAFFRPAEGFWYVLRSENASFYGFPFGSNGDVPVPGDYDGDGVTDAAVYRPSNNGWYIQKSTGGIEFFTFGISGDVPTIADYDGDGKTDLAINRINNGNREWWIRRSSNGQIFAATFGETSDKAVQGDYTGDGKADIAFWRESNGFWYILRSEDFSFYGFPFGTSGDKPTPGDYDGDGKFDPSVFRPSNSGWYQLRSTQGFTGVTFGISGDIPIPSVFVN